MGLFSMKTVTCSQCGKEFQTRIAFLDLCDECSKQQFQQDELQKQQQKQKSERVKGYVQYAKEMNWEKYSVAQLEEISAHRDQLWDYFRWENSITREELQLAGKNYSSLSEQEAIDILQRARQATVIVGGGAGFGGPFFVPLGFEGTVVDTRDVFAVGIAEDWRYNVDNHETLLCIAFTNDPYIPAFPVLLFGEIGFFEVFHSKKGRKLAEALFTLRCPNLTYPIQNIGALKRQIMKERCVKGNISMDTMRSLFSQISSGSGVFKTKHIDRAVPAATAKMLEDNGFFMEEDITKLLRLDSMLPKRFWKKIETKLDD